MSEAIAYAGGALMAAATLPQAWRLLKQRDASQFTWTFTALNFAGIGMLAVRSWEIGEAAFLAINVVTAAFWGLVVALKLGQPRGRPRRQRRSSRLVAASARAGRSSAGGRI